MYIGIFPTFTIWKIWTPQQKEFSLCFLSLHLHPPPPQQHVALNLHFLPLWLSMSMYLCLFSNCWRSRSFWEWVDHASQWTRLHFLGGKNMHRVQRANAFCSSSHRLLPSQVIGFSGNLQLLMKYRKSQVRLILNSQCCG